MKFLSYPFQRKIMLNLAVVGLSFLGSIRCHNKTESPSNHKSVAVPIVNPAAASPPLLRDLPPYGAVTLSRGKPWLFPDYNEFPTYLKDCSCRLVIKIVETGPHPMQSAEPATSRNWSMNGVITITKDDATVDITLTGILELLPDDDMLGRHWCIRSGSLEVSALGSPLVQLTLLNDEENSITIEESGGGGRFIALFMARYAPGPWSLALPNLYRLKLPVDLTDHILAMRLPATSVTDLAPFQPRSTSDFNEDGVLEYSSDFAAYLRDFDLHTPLADMNDDDQWNGDDIDLWIDSFGEDYFAAARRWL